jgi:hypothetical protein
MVRKHTKRFRRRCRRKVLEHYGKVCACCGEAEERFLTVDHINNDGYIHRRKVDGKRTIIGSCMTAWLVKNNFPEGFQILCFNCNLGRAANGGICPHKVSKEPVVFPPTLPGHQGVLFA